jgi:hypothetical protein
MNKLTAFQIKDRIQKKINELSFKDKDNNLISVKNFCKTIDDNDTYTFIIKKPTDVEVLNFDDVGDELYDLVEDLDIDDCVFYFEVDEYKIVIDDSTYDDPIDDVNVDVDELELAKKSNQEHAPIENVNNDDSDVDDDLESPDYGDDSSEDSKRYDKFELETDQDYDRDDDFDKSEEDENEEDEDDEDEIYDAAMKQLAEFNKLPPLVRNFNYTPEKRWQMLRYMYSDFTNPYGEFGIVELNKDLTDAHNIFDDDYYLRNSDGKIITSLEGESKKEFIKRLEKGGFVIVNSEDTPKYKFYLERYGKEAEHIDAFLRQLKIVNNIINSGRFDDESVESAKDGREHIISMLYKHIKQMKTYSDNQKLYRVERIKLATVLSNPRFYGEDIKMKDAIDVNKLYQSSDIYSNFNIIIDKLSKKSAYLKSKLSYTQYDPSNPLNNFILIPNMNSINSLNKWSQKTGYDKDVIDNTHHEFNISFSVCIKTLARIIIIEKVDLKNFENVTLQIDSLNKNKKPNHPDFINVGTIDSTTNTCDYSNLIDNLKSQLDKYKDLIKNQLSSNGNIKCEINIDDTILNVFCYYEDLNFNRNKDLNILNRNDNSYKNDEISNKDEKIYKLQAQFALDLYNSIVDEINSDTDTDHTDELEELKEFVDGNPMNIWNKSEVSNIIDINVYNKCKSRLDKQIKNEYLTDLSKPETFNTSSKNEICADIINDRAKTQFIIKIPKSTIMTAINNKKQELQECNVYYNDAKLVIDYLTTNYPSLFESINNNTKFNLPKLKNEKFDVKNTIEYYESMLQYNTDYWKKYNTIKEMVYNGKISTKAEFNKKFRNVEYNYNKNDEFYATFEHLLKLLRDHTDFEEQKNYHEFESKVLENRFVGTVIKSLKRKFTDQFKNIPDGIVDILINNEIKKAIKSYYDNGTANSSSNTGSNSTNKYKFVQRKTSDLRYNDKNKIATKEKQSEKNDQNKLEASRTALTSDYISKVVNEIINPTEISKSIKNNLKNEEYVFSKITKKLEKDYNFKTPETINKESNKKIEEDIDADFKSKVDDIIKNFNNIDGGDYLDRKISKLNMVTSGIKPMYIKYRFVYPTSYNGNNDNKYKLILKLKQPIKNDNGKEVDYIIMYYQPKNFKFKIDNGFNYFDFGLERGNKYSNIYDLYETKEMSVNAITKYLNDNNFKYKMKKGDFEITANSQKIKQDMCDYVKKSTEKNPVQNVLNVDYPAITLTVSELKVDDYTNTFTISQATAECDYPTSSRATIKYLKFDK